MTVKKNFTRWVPHNLSKAQKKSRVDWSKWKFIFSRNSYGSAYGLPPFYSTKNLNIHFKNGAYIKYENTSQTRDIKYSSKIMECHILWTLLEITPHSI